MKKIKSVQEYVEALDAAKKVNPKDLSSDQDLTIGIMNLISIEEHLMFSGAKTGKHEFYDLINDVREMRKNAMLKIIPAYEGEVWCISKHLLAAAMRVFEVGTKALASGDKKTAYELLSKHSATIVYINQVTILRDDETYYIVSANENNVVISDDRAVKLVARIER
jgi:hypothetical protein